MSQNTQWDGLDWDKFNFPYTKIEPRLSTAPRIVAGENLYVTLGGTLAKRPGVIPLDNNSEFPGFAFVDNMISYTTIETEPVTYLIASVREIASAYNKIYYKRMSEFVVNPWTLMPAIRDNQFSRGPHEMVVSRGKVYIRSVPDPASAEKLGTFVFDGTGGVPNVKPWGILGPTVPAQLDLDITKLAAAINATTTTITVASAAGFPTVFPYLIQVGYEQMEVAAGPPGTSWTVVRGANGTLPAAHGIDEAVIYLDWASSDHPVDVNFGWEYSYAYVSSTGQVSNRSARATNPDKPGSRTGPFFDLIPKIVVTGTADTTNIPFINIYRTTDGGGTPYFLYQIPNPGATTVVFEDKYLGSGPAGTTFADPIPDADLNTAEVGPGLDSNSPPPANTAPSVTGVDPVMRSTPIASYAGRLWYAIGNLLFYSADEELNTGIPEESWPGGLRNANFFRYPLQVTNIIATDNALLVFTTKNSHRIVGTNRETFASQPLFENVGMPLRQPRAICRFGNSVAILTQEYRIAKITDNNISVISDPLGNEIVDLQTSQSWVSMAYFGDVAKEWIVVNSYPQIFGTPFKQWVYDIKKSAMLNSDFWFTPWTVRATIIISDSIYANSPQRRLIFGTTTENSGAGVGYLTTDGDPSPVDLLRGVDYPIDYYATFHQMLVPAGNHVNGLRQPGITPTVYRVELDRILYDAEEDPLVEHFYDDLWTTPQPAVLVDPPPRRNLSKGYKTLNYNIHQACQRYSLQFASTLGNQPFALIGLRVIWDPNAGA